MYKSILTADGICIMIPSDRQQQSHRIWTQTCALALKKAAAERETSHFPQTAWRTIFYFSGFLFTLRYCLHYSHDSMYSDLMITSKSLMPSMNLVFQAKTVKMYHCHLCASPGQWITGSCHHNVFLISRFVSKWKLL